MQEVCLLVGMLSDISNCIGNKSTCEIAWCKISISSGDTTDKNVSYPISFSKICLILNSAETFSTDNVSSSASASYAHVLSHCANIHTVTSSSCKIRVSRANNPAHLLVIGY